MSATAFIPCRLHFQLWFVGVGRAHSTSKGCGEALTRAASGSRASPATRAAGSCRIHRSRHTGGGRSWHASAAWPAGQLSSESARAVPRLRVGNSKRSERARAPTRPPAAPARPPTRKRKSMQTRANLIRSGGNRTPNKISRHLLRGELQR